SAWSACERQCMIGCVFPCNPAQPESPSTHSTGSGPYRQLPPAERFRCSLQQSRTFPNNVSMDEQKKPQAAAQTNNELLLDTDPNYFSFLGLPRSLGIDEEDLQRRYFELSRQHHPDFHALSDEPSRQSSLELSSTLNQAYRTLRDR